MREGGHGENSANSRGFDRGGDETLQAFIGRAPATSWQTRKCRCFQGGGAAEEILQGQGESVKGGSEYSGKHSTNGSGGQADRGRGKGETKDYGRDGKLRYPSLSQISLGFTISVLATVSTVLTPHSPFEPVRIPWWSGVLFCVIGTIPLLPLRKSEKFKLRTILGMNIIGLLIAITSMGLSVWNGINQNASDATCMSSYHWIITFFAAFQLALSGWIISLTTFWLDKEFKN
ncbi:uncharacterized protein [Chiloscyllium punctatum]|uniref:uncharacterized protein isoform X3 n=1 Tax=Chiloscyllium punctatum TaxID=137246 RepID=UPI003B640F15